MAESERIIIYDWMINQLGLKVSDYVVYAYLYGLCGEDNKCMVQHSDIAAATKISLRRVKGIIEKLRHLDIIHKEEGTRNTYIIESAKTALSEGKENSESAKTALSEESESAKTALSEGKENSESAKTALSEGKENGESAKTALSEESESAENKHVAKNARQRKNKRQNCTQPQFCEKKEVTKKEEDIEELYSPRINNTHSKGVVQITRVRAREGKPKKVHSEDFIKFVDWIKRNAPRVMKMKQPFTEEEFNALRQEYSAKEVAETILQMHNYTPLLVKNLSAYLTCRNWMNRERAKQKGGYQRKESNAEQTERMAAELGIDLSSGFSVLPND